jgi:hypothetical protein
MPRSAASASSRPLIQGVKLMPSESIVIATVVAAFGVFAATLLWADLQTRAVGK